MRRPNVGDCRAKFHKGFIFSARARGGIIVLMAGLSLPRLGSPTFGTTEAPVAPRTGASLLPSAYRQAADLLLRRRIDNQRVWE